MINSLRPLVFQIVGSIVVAVIMAAATTSYTLSIKTRETETSLSAMKERISSMEARGSATDKAQITLEGRLVRLEVSIEQLKEVAKDTQRLIQAFVMKPSHRRDMEEIESMR